MAEPVNDFILVGQDDDKTAEHFTGTIDAARAKAALVATKLVKPVEIFQLIGTMKNRIDPDHNWEPVGQADSTETSTEQHS